MGWIMPGNLGIWTNLPAIAGVIGLAIAAML